MTGKLRTGSIMVEEGRLDHQIAEVVYRVQGLPEWLMVSRVSTEYEAGSAAIELISHSGTAWRAGNGVILLPDNSTVWPTLTGLNLT